MRKIWILGVLLLGCSPVWAGTGLDGAGVPEIEDSGIYQLQTEMQFSTLPATVYIFNPKYYGEVNLGFALPSENIKFSEVWEIRGGLREDAKFMRSLSLGFSNYSSDDTETAPDRLVPGGLALRTINAEFRHSFLTIRKFRLNAGAGIGWTFVAHSPSGNIELRHLDPYHSGEKVIATKERVHDNFSLVFKSGAEYKWNDLIVLEGLVKYFMLHTFRERTVLLYDEYSKAHYNDRYFTYSTISPVSFDHFSLNLSLKLLF